MDRLIPLNWRPLLNAENGSSFAKFVCLGHFWLFLRRQRLLLLSLQEELFLLNPFPLKLFPSLLPEIVSGDLTVAVVLVGDPLNSGYFRWLARAAERQGRGRTIIWCAPSQAPRTRHAEPMINCAAGHARFAFGGADSVSGPGRPT